MTSEEKSLLLKDLSARLAYYPKCEMIDELRVVNNEKDSSYISTLFPKHIELFSYHNNFTIKPYLRPMSSMTEEEKKYVKNRWCYEDWYGIHDFLNHYQIDASDVFDFVDWLNENMFDYRGLIEKGLAIAVTDENNPYKE